MPLHNGQAEWEEAIAQLLAQAEAAREPRVRVQHLQQAADIYETQLRDAEKAYAVWQAAFLEDFTSERSAKALERLADQLDAGAQLAADTRSRVSETTDPFQRAALLAWVGQWLARYTDERGAAQAHLIEAMRLDPQSAIAGPALRALAGDEADATPTPPPRERRVTPPPPSPTSSADVLHQRLDKLVEQESWGEAIEVLDALSVAADPPLRAKYLATAAKIHQHKLDEPELAAGLFERALDADPVDMAIFERLYQMQAGRQAWRDAEAALLRMIGRLGEIGAPETAPALEALWRRLGDVYRVRLADLPSAVRAYEMCARLAPQDPSYPAILAELARSERAGRHR